MAVPFLKIIATLCPIFVDGPYYKQYMNRNADSTLVGRVGTLRRLADLAAQRDGRYIYVAVAPW